MVTILHEQQATAPPGARAAGEQLWLDADGIAAATGWLWKPEGLCQGDICVPLPPAERGSWVHHKPGQPPQLDIAAMWRHSGHPVVHDAAGQTWVLGTGPAQRGAALQSLEAPDFTLPDLAGQPHRLSDLRGRRVMLVSWASW